MNRLYDDDNKYFKEILKLKVMCKCGHNQLVASDKAICDWCGRWVYRDKKQEFRERVKEKIRRVK